MLVTDQGDAERRVPGKRGLLPPSRMTPPTAAGPSTTLLESLGQERIAFRTQAASACTSVSWISTKHVYPAANVHADQQTTTGNTQPWRIVQRIVPLRSESVQRQERGQTLIFVQPHCETIETAEPMLQRLVADLEEANAEGLHIEEIFNVSLCADGVNDLRQFVDFYLPTPTSSQDLLSFGPHWYPKLLTRQSNGVARKRRTIVIVGVKEGASVAAQLCATSPSQYAERLVAIEPLSLTETDPTVSTSWNSAVRTLFDRFNATRLDCPCDRLASMPSSQEVWSELLASKFDGSLDVLCSKGARVLSSSQRVRSAILSNADHHRHPILVADAIADILQGLHPTFEPDNHPELRAHL